MKLRLLILLIPVLFVFMGCPQEVESEKDFDPISGFTVDVGKVVEDNNIYFIAIPENTSMVSIGVVTTDDNITIVEETGKAELNPDNNKFEVNYGFPFVELEFVASNDKGDKKSYSVVIQQVTPD